MKVLNIICFLIYNDIIFMVLFLKKKEYRSLGLWIGENLEIDIVSEIAWRGEKDFGNGKSRGCRKIQLIEVFEWIKLIKNSEFLRLINRFGA